MVDVDKRTSNDREKKFEEDRRFYVVLKKRLDYFKKVKEFSERDYEISKKLLDFEIKHSKLVDGKPEYLNMQEYMDLLNERKKLDFEVREMKLKDEIAHADKSIEDIQKEIKRLKDKYKFKD